MIDLLDDSTTYRRLKKDPINKITSKVHEMIKSWRESDIITESTYKHLNCTNGNLPRCYGQPKVHKTNFPLRIIVSTVGSPLYNLSCFLHDILQASIPKPNSYIKDSWSFVRAVTNFHIKNSETLVSFDVVSLYTNIPATLVIQSITNRWSHISKKTKMNLSQFLYAIRMVLESTSFKFNDIIFEQIFGSPMGSPLSPILADMVMVDLESHCLGMLNFDVSLFYRYVDDVFAIVPVTEVRTILDALNSYHPRLQFTYELESNGSLSFLDTRVIRDNGVLITNWFRKPTFSGRYLNFFSHHPLKYKVSVINSLVDRAVLLSDARFHNDNLGIINDILVNNGYPFDIINLSISNRLKAICHSQPDTSVTTIPEFKGVLAIPYVKGLSEGISSVLRDLSFKVLYTLPNKLNSIIKKGKDRLDLLKQTQVVYKIDCIDCNAVYVGQTKRHLCTRLREHQRDIRQNPNNLSVVSEHRVSLGHDFDWLHPTVLHCEAHLRKREIAEMIYIKKNSHAINLQRDTENFNSIYDRILNVI